MKTYRNLYKPLILLLFLASCQSNTKSSSVEVKVYGKLMEIMQQNQLQARVQVDDIDLTNNSYGLGAIEGLAGEIMILEGQPILSKATTKMVEIENSNSVGAALLVTTEVSDWNKIETEPTSNFSDLEKLIEIEALRLNLNTDEIIPFRIKGKVNNLSWHIINASLTTEQSHQAYKEAGQTGSIQDENVEIIGFYSRNHQGVFTHHGSFIHIHFLSENKELMGHVDDLNFKESFSLYLPKTEEP